MKQIQQGLNRLKRSVQNVKKIKPAAFVKRAVSFAETLGKLAIFFAIVNYFWEAPERATIRHYQAWELIDLAHSLPGDGGRRQALGGLTRDNVDLSYIDLQGANISYADLRGASIAFSNLENADLVSVDFGCRSQVHFSNYFIPNFACWSSNLNDVDFRGATVFLTNFSHAELLDAKFGPSRSTKPIFPKSSPIQSISSSNFSYVSLQNTKGAPKNVSFSNCNFEYSHIYSDFEPFTFIGKNTFKHAYLQTFRLNQSVFDDLEGKSDFTSATIVGTNTNGHNLSEHDLPDVVLCHTKINGKISNRDCPTGISTSS